MKQKLILVSLIILCFVTSFFIELPKIQKKDNIIIDKKIATIMRIFDYYNSDLSMTEKFLCATKIIELEKKYKRINGIELLSLMKVESGLKHRDNRGEIKTSYKGAKGITQIMPATSRGLAGRYGFRDRGIKTLNDPIMCIYIAGRYLSDLKKEHKQDKYAFESYNRGAINKKKIKRFPYWEKIKKNIQEIAKIKVEVLK